MARWCCFHQTACWEQSYQPERRCKDHRFLLILHVTPAGGLKACSTSRYFKMDSVNAATTFHQCCIYNHTALSISVLNIHGRSWFQRAKCAERHHGGCVLENENKWEEKVLVQRHDKEMNDYWPRLDVWKLLGGENTKTTEAVGCSSREEPESRRRPYRTRRKSHAKWRGCHFCLHWKENNSVRGNKMCLKWGGFDETSFKNSLY